MSPALGLMLLLCAADPANLATGGGGGGGGGGGPTLQHDDEEATITAESTALVHRVTQPGAQAKFPGILDYLG
eukprot:COSAG04_NODE_26091_length_299_cov_1.040000_1_plen_72_part_01